MTEATLGKGPEAPSGLLFTAARVLYFLLLLYLFFFSIELMGTAFKMGGRSIAEQLINTAADPVAGLILGFLATSLIQSSSTATTIVVGLVASGGLSIELAVPIVMGANIGTTTTNTIVSMGHVTRASEFERAFAASTVHDFFNILAALTILPIEIYFHPVQKSAEWAEHVFEGAGGMSLASPLKAVVKPLSDFMADAIPYEIPLVLLALTVLFVALQQMMKVMRGALLDRMEGLFSRVLFRNDALSFGLGAITTASVQSSSATTSLVVPLAGTGVLTLRQVFPYTLGANIGTTVTAILASFSTGNPAAVTVALAHLTFNILGIAIYYPLRALPIWLAEKTGKLAAQSKASSATVIAIYIALHIVPVAYLFLSQPPARGAPAMWSDILSLFKGAGLPEEAFDEALIMLEESAGMFRDCVAALHADGALVTDIYERDRQINRYQRSVRRKIATHMSVSSKPDINIALVLTAVVIDIERIGDYTKNIAELAATLDEPFDALELDEDVGEIESSLDGMFGKVAAALKGSDEESAREVMESHARVSEIVERDILRLRRRKVLKGRSGHAVTVAIYLRYLKRVSAHLKNVATSVVNPYHRIGFREKDEPVA